MNYHFLYQISLRDVARLVNILTYGKWRQSPLPQKQTPNDLRKIFGTLNFSKLFEKFLAEAMIKDMTSTSDPSQYRNEKGISTQYYLIKMIDRVLTCLDRNNSKEAYAVITESSI